MSSNNTENNLFVQYYLVVFFDLLGQRAALREIQSIPSSGEEKEFYKTIKKTFGRVDLVRRLFRGFFEKQSAGPINESLVPKDRLDEFKESLKVDVDLYFFSDCVAIGVPLAGDDEHCTAMNGIHSAFVASSGVLLALLGSKTAARAGMDVGIAAKLPESDIYGPALERAVFLESQLAEYPRLVMGEQVIRYLQTVKDQTPKSNAGKIAKQTATRCLKMIMRDTDGRYVLDFLGQQIKDDTKSSLQQTVAKAFSFIQAELRRYESQGNERLASRYYRLVKYFESRLPIWSQEVENEG